MKLFFTVLSICVFGFCLTTEAQNTQKIAIKQSDASHLKTNSPKITTSTRPQSVKARGVRGNDIIGEGEYLNFNKKIMERSVTGEIPVGFPKHIIGQTKKEYVEIMVAWGKKNPTLVTVVPGEGEYLNFDKEIMERSITGTIPENFPKHKIGQTEERYVQIMKTWGKNNPDKFKKVSKSNIAK
jgi:hypothetical protein